ncbi:MAG: hypothetical protein J6Y22_04870 [Paludibacteraceae bacterium]|nr:hypothetical protein [Paludibacteraceae bacterium]
MMQTIQIIEHQSLNESSDWEEQYTEQLQSVKFVGVPTQYMSAPQYLGIDQNYRASYFIGASWLIRDELAVVVTPKVEDTDFVKMFLAALEVDSQNESDYFSDCYGIRFDEPAIQTPVCLNQLTPLLVLHYLSLLDRLVKRGLKKDYITREENMKAKVKGRIMMGRHLQQNVFQQRQDRIYCQFQEYTDDTPENRLLKRALVFCERIMAKWTSLQRQLSKTDIPLLLNLLKSRFGHISDDIEPYQIQHLATNKLFKEYREAIRVAKMLLRRFDYSVTNANDEEYNATPPFWIDMARLYEMWVWSKLKENSVNEVLFQKRGFYGRQVADFVIREEKLILDAKYKPDYQNKNHADINDIREISGNARDERLLPGLPEDYSPRCIILYPGQDCELQKESEKLFGAQGTKIPHYHNFYKISVPLPKK